MYRTPVRDDEAFEAPFILENLGQQFVVLGTVAAVEFVVGAHHRPGFAVLDGGLEGR